jgi:two-component system NtrC family sensor kinase
MTALDKRIAQLEAELTAAQKTVETLKRRMNRSMPDDDAGDFGVSRVIARLQSRFEEKSEELAQAAASYQALYDNMPEMVLIVDQEGTIHGCNLAAQVGLGHEEADIVGLTISEVFEPETGGALLSLYTSGFQGAGESEVSLPDGRKLGFSIARIDEARNQLVLRDVTPRQRLQDELLHTRRMASVGRLAGGIAHEINNPLAVIQGRVEMLRAVPDMQVETRNRHLDILEEHCRRVSRIVRNLHTFARPHNPDPRWLDLHEVVESARGNLGRRLERVKFVVDLTPELRVFADPEQIELVLVNLLSNATDSSPSGREVRVSARGMPDGGVEFRVQDDGPGLSEDIMSDLRAPYAAGSAMVEAGRGLGMSISWGIVQDHGGWLTAENLLPRGTSVIFQLPGPVPSPGPEGGPQAQAWSILVVDDDHVMCETIAWMLTTDGHRIVSMHSAEDALEQIASERFDMVITDQRLPGMDGEGLIAAIEDRWPELTGRTVLTSGLLYRPRQTHRYLQKPFSRAQLLKMLSEVGAD